MGRDDVPRRSTLRDSERSRIIRRPTLLRIPPRSLSARHMCCAQKQARRAAAKVRDGTIARSHGLAPGSALGTSGNAAIHRDQSISQRCRAVTLAVKLIWRPSFRDVRLPHQVLIWEPFRGRFPTSGRTAGNVMHSSLLNAEHPLLWTTIHQCDTMPRTATAQRVKQISSDSDSLRAILSLQNLCLKKAPKPDK